LRNRVALGHSGGEFGEFFHVGGRAGVVRAEAPVSRGEAKGRANVEGSERVHYRVKPAVRPGDKGFSPAEPGAYLLDAKPLQPAHGNFERALVAELEPLADAKFRVEVAHGELRRTVVPKKAEVKVTPVRAAFRLFVACGRFVSGREVEQGVPEYPLPTKQVAAAAQTPAIDPVSDVTVISDAPTEK